MGHVAFGWPMDFADGMESVTRKKIVCLDGCAFWPDESWMYAVESADSLWGIYPASLVDQITQCRLKKNVGLTEIDDITLESQLGRRTDGPNLSATRVRSSYGFKKFGDLMSGVSTSTRKCYA